MDFTKLDKKACFEEFPREKYQLILVDPPYCFQKGSKRYQGTVKYPTMTLKALKKLPVWDIAEQDCALLLWTTGVFLEDAFKLIRAWGFTPTSPFLVWRKTYKDGTPVCGLGHYTRSCHEFLLLGKRGRIMKFRRRSDLNELIDNANRFDNTLISERFGHSVKPDAAMEIIEEFWDCPRKVELFARKQRTGWACWGLEIDGYFHNTTKQKLMDCTDTGKGGS